ncbi:MAG: hypothetical protein LKG17_07235 [Megasphaera sp.]|nr:hypothetical protein [Megasphaera sp.]
MKIANYAAALKKLIKFTKAKSTNLADYVGYDLSYISKWSGGAKLPSSRSVERINSEMGRYFADLIRTQGNEALFFRIFAIDAHTDDLPFAIAQYLASAYRASLQKNPLPAAENKSTVHIITGSNDTAQFLSTVFDNYLKTLTGHQDILIYGEFCALYDAGFWQYLDTNVDTPDLQITVGLDRDKLEQHTEYVQAIYHILNKNLNMDFTFYDIHDMEYANLIIVKDAFVIQYALLPSRGFTLCTYIENQSYVRDIYGKFNLENTNKTALLTSVQSLWMVDRGYRISFYAASKFLFFLTNGFEYLLPPEVFDHIIHQAAPEQVPAIERLRITWEEILLMANMTIIAPSSSLIRYLESGCIDLTDMIYTLDPDERKKHILYVLELMKQKNNLSIGMLSQAGNASIFQEANLAFYSNYKTGFFKKNPLHIESETNSFYVILDKRLHTIFLNFFLHLQELPQYYEYKEPELTQKLALYKPLLEKILSFT